MVGNMTVIVQTVLPEDPNLVNKERRLFVYPFKSDSGSPRVTFFRLSYGDKKECTARMHQILSVEGEEGERLGV